jgi:hypothetical protein
MQARSVASGSLRCVSVEWYRLHETGSGDFLEKIRVLMTRQEIMPERLADATAAVGLGERG